MISLLDLVAQYHSIKEEIDNAVQSVLESGKFILGPNVFAFESEVAEYTGVKHAVGVASGTDALTIALRAVDIGPADEVIVPAFSFFATVGTVLSLGASPVFVDVNAETLLIDHTAIEEVITPKTKAIVPVHLYGQPADMDEILAVANHHNLMVIEDNAQAFGAEYRGRKTGSIGHLGCLSFFPSKNLGAYGDAGMITTNSDELAEKVRMLRTHGWKKKYYPEILGYNSRLDEMQATILRVKLKHVDEWNERRHELALEYSNLLAGLNLNPPVEASNRKHVYHLYVVRFSNRDQVQRHLKEAGIASEIYYPQPLHLTTPCRPLGYSEGMFPVAEQASQELLALPLYPEMPKTQINIVVASIKNLLG